jgi:hypothetical protein
VMQSRKDRGSELEEHAPDAGRRALPGGALLGSLMGAQVSFWGNVSRIRVAVPGRRDIAFSRSPAMSLD